MRSLGFRYTHMYQNRGRAHFNAAAILRIGDTGTGETKLIECIG